MLAQNVKDNCWDGNVPVKFDFTNWNAEFGVYNSRVIVRSKKNITNEEVNSAFIEVMSHLGHLSKKTILHPEIIVQLCLLYCGAQLVFPHQKRKGTYILTGLRYFHVLRSLHKLSNNIPDEMKATSEFRGEILIGYKYKHLKESSISSLAKNVSIQMKKPHWFEYQIEKYQDQLDSAETFREQSAIFTHIATVEALKARTSNQSMTGEWIIFNDKPEGLELLTIGVHDESDEEIKSRIDSTKTRIVLTHEHSVSECQYKPLFV